MKNKIQKSDFTLLPAGHGHYKVIYQSPTTGKIWTTTTSNMPLIDKVKNIDYPTLADLNRLKYLCKNI